MYCDNRGKTPIFLLPIIFLGELIFILNRLPMNRTVILNLALAVMCMLVSCSPVYVKYLLFEYGGGEMERYHYKREVLKSEMKYMIEEDSFSMLVWSRYVSFPGGAWGVDVHETIYNKSRTPMVLPIQGDHVMIDGFDIEHEYSTIWESGISDHQFVKVDTLIDVSESVVLKAGDTVHFWHHYRSMQNMKFRRVDKNRDTIQGQLLLKSVYTPDGKEYQYAPIELVPEPRN